MVDLIKDKIQFNPFYALLAVLYLISLCLFYYIYVPLTAVYQITLAPVLFLSFILVLADIEKGILFFVLAFPLINNIPNFFGFYEKKIPHAPTALVLFLAFFGGWLFRKSFISSKWKSDEAINRPLILLSLIIIISGLITFFRYANFFPFVTDKIHDLVINVNSVRSGGAIMSDVFSLLHYLTGFFVFVLLLNCVQSMAFLKKIITVLSLAVFVSLVFALVQKLFSINLGNSLFWANLGQINATYKDPNSFGVILASFFPIFMAMALAERKGKRAFFILLILLGAGVFPFIGSRSPLLGIAVSLLTFFFLYQTKEKIKLGKNSRSRLMWGGILALGIIFVFFFRYSILAERYIILTNNIFRPQSFGLVSNGKLELWTIAGFMVRDFPLTGIGLGSFIVELSNYGQRLGWTLFRNYSDSAENLFLHVGAELGLIGLFLLLWLCLKIIRKARSGWIAFPLHSPNQFLFLGAVCSVECFFVNYIFHSYIGSYEVNYVFWIMVAIIFLLVRQETKLAVPSQPRKCIPFILTATFLGIFFGGLHLWNSIHSLSIRNRTEIFKWNQNYGLYQEETGTAGFAFRWTQKSAGITIDKLGPVAVIPLMASHPDIEKYPVRVKIYRGKPDFTKGKIIREVVLKNHSWLETEIDMSDESRNKLFLIFETDRAWIPRQYSRVPDFRSLAVGLGDIWYKYSSEIPGEPFGRVEEISSQNWEGSQNNALLKNGESHIHFNSKDRCFLRLMVKGSKAQGIGPLVFVRLDGVLLAKTYLNHEDWTSLILPVQADAGEHDLSVAFANDFFLDEHNDRNLFLGRLDILYPVPRYL
jgi:O-antigen ligase